jgi:ATP-dependent helicase/nuclease subunit B
MSGPSRPQVYAIAAHRGFADALVAGLIPRYADPHLGLARLTLLLPSSRAVRAMTEAFVRVSGGGMLLPRMAIVGDRDLDETLGPLFDTLGADSEVPPAADPLRRWLRLGAFLAGGGGPGRPTGTAARLRRAREIARAMDRLLVEEVPPEALRDKAVAAIVDDQSEHWRRSTAEFAEVQARWLAELAERGEIDGPSRSNLLFDRLARRWRAAPPPHPVIAAGITSASPALARLLRAVAELPHGAVILPDLDLALDDEVWQALGSAGVARAPGEAPIGPTDAVTHPQYHLKLLLNRMGIARAEVQPWHRSGLGAAAPQRSRVISNLFLPPRASVRWAGLKAAERRLAGMRLMEAAHPGEEAQAIAILIRQALETPGRRVALVTPDRGLSTRVVAHLRRWNIAADDSAGQPLSQSARGRLLLHLAEVVAQEMAPVPLIAALTHPLVRAGDGRAGWIEQARRFELALRGPRPAPGLAPLRAVAEKARVAVWWSEAEDLLAPLPALQGEVSLDVALDTLAAVAEALCGEAIWSHPDGRGLARFIEDLRLAAGATDTRIEPRELHAVLRDAMDGIAVRPTWGGHPRVAIYGLLEARMARADLMICGGLVEGVWPAAARPDPLLPPPVLRALGVPGAEFRIGLAAHDLAAALGAPEVVLSWARRDEAGPRSPSRFILRIKAMLGDQAADHEESAALAWGRAVDDGPPAEPHPRPMPRPSAAQRQVDISATGLDRLRSDPYQFYAASILGLRRIDPLDAAPSPAWQGTTVHAILDRWHRRDARPGELVPLADAYLETMAAHPLMRGLWRPRLFAALKCIDERIAGQGTEGRHVLVSEADGAMTFAGVRVHARADRIDRLPDNGLAIVDYKTGHPPGWKMVKEGYSLQLGLIGLIAQDGGFEGVSGVPQEFEYWSLARDRNRKDEPRFGYVATPFKTDRIGNALEREDFLPVTAGFLRDAIERWITGSDPFTARLNPDLPVYSDYDQLMRLDEWLPRLTQKQMAEQ